MLRFFASSLVILLFQEYEVGFPFSTQAHTLLSFLHKKYTLSFFSTIGLIAIPLVTSLVIDSVLGRRFLILDMLFGRRDKKGGADWQAFQALNWICSAIFTLSMTHLFSSNDIRSLRKIATNNEMRLALVLAFLSITYLFAFFGVSLAAHDIARTTSRDRSATGLTSYVPPIYYLGVVGFVWYLDTSFTVRSLVTISTMLFFAALHLSKQISLSTTESPAAPIKKAAPVVAPAPAAASIIDSASPVCKADPVSTSNMYKKYEIDVAIRTADWFKQLRYDLLMYVIPLSAIGIASPMLRPVIHGIAFMMTFAMPAYLFVAKHLFFRESPRENEAIAADRLTSYPHKYVNGWFRVISADELKPGTVKYIAANGRHLAVFRGDSDHKVKCIDAHCVHLGANMAIGGRVINNCLECPFHKWSFNGSGQCTDIPYAESFPASTKTRAYHVCEYYDEIVVWIHSEDIAPTYYPPNIPKIDSGHMIQKGVLKTTVNMHINEFAENSTDFMHFDPLHGRMVLPLTPFEIPGLSINHRPDWKEGTGDQSHIAWFMDKADLSFCGMPIPESGADACITFVGPAGVVFFSFETPIGSIVLFQLHTPWEPLRLGTTFRWYADSTMPRLLVFYVVGMWLAQWRNDIFVWENKRFASKALLVKGDGPMMRQRRWFKQFYPSTPAPGTASALTSSCTKGESEGDGEDQRKQRSTEW